MDQITKIVIKSWEKRSAGTLPSSSFSSGTSGASGRDYAASDFSAAFELISQSERAYQAFEIQICTPVRIWTVWRRYSEFEQLHQQWLDRWPDRIPPSPLPRKTSVFSLFASQRFDAEKLEIRRQELERYLFSVLNAKEDCWRRSGEWRSFLGITEHTASKSMGMPVDSGSESTVISNEQWMDTYRELQMLYQDIRSLCAYRDRIISNGEAAHEQTLQAKKQIVVLNQRLSILGDSLSDVKNLKSISETEVLRRKNLWQNLRLDTERLSKSLNTRPTNVQRNDLLKDNSASSSLSSSRPKRVFGVPVETEQTRQLDNGGLLNLQQEVLQDQDQKLDQLLSTVIRQKEIGNAIGSELDVQNELLQRLDDKVVRTDQRLKNATNMAKRLT